MKNQKSKFIVQTFAFCILITITYSKYLPFESNNSINIFLSQYGSVIKYFSIISQLFLIVIFMVKRKNTLLVILLVFSITPVFFSSKIEMYCNNYIIEKNKSKSVNEISNFILGYRLEKKDSAAEFIYDDTFLIYKSLIFDPNHNIKEITFENKSEVKYIYNDNWWLYHHQD